MPNQLDPQKALETARTAAAAGRAVLLEYFGRLKNVQEKAHAGLVSEADLESERVIGEILRREFPEIPILGEEGAFASGENAVPETAWIVDPLDGTTNYVHGFHVFNVSVGLQWRGEPIVGVIDVPVLDKTYHAVKGGGAWVSFGPRALEAEAAQRGGGAVPDKRLSVSQRGRISQALLATGFFPDETNALDEQLKIFPKLVYEARGIRRAGAAAYDLCLVAEGVFDAFWEPNLKPWDAAAGIVMVREAGGVVWDYSGAQYKLGTGLNRLLSGNRPLAEELVRVLSLRD